MIWVVPQVYGQAKSKTEQFRIIRSNIGIGGSSKTMQTLKGKYVVSQSVGQASVIGTSSKNGYYLRQGFQQPHKKIKIVKSTESSTLNATAYPNPFGEIVTIAFDENTAEDIVIEIHDINGKRVYARTVQPLKKIQLHLKNLSTGSYMLRAASGGKVFSSKLIKL
ncbi:hypothetical protein MHTCC0001_11770 [Flavobacteriaceae bacterium MHTCC 0001]